MAEEFTAYVSDNSKIKATVNARIEKIYKRIDEIEAFITELNKEKEILTAEVTSLKSAHDFYNHDAHLMVTKAHDGIPPGSMLPVDKDWKPGK